MADNIVLSAGSADGAVIATDDDGIAHHQYVKLEFGADNTQTKVTSSVGLPTDMLDRATRDMGKVDIAMGQAAHDAAGAAIDPIAIAGYASAAAPTDVTADGDICRIWTTLKGAVNIADAGGTISIDDGGGNISIDDGGNSITVDGSVSVTDGNGSLTVDNAALSVTGGGVEASALRVTIASDSTGVVSVDDNGGSITVDGTVTANLAAGTNNIGDVDVLSVVPGTAAASLGKAEDAAHSSGDTGVYALAVRDDSPAAHSDTDGDYESLHVNAEGGLWVSPTPSASGGLSIFRSIDLDESEEEIKASAGCVYGMWVSNLATSTRFVKFYNATAANVVVGTTTPVITIAIPGNSSDDITGFFSSANGIAFGTAISVAATTGVADNDTGAPGLNEVLINVFYK